LQGQGVSGNPGQEIKKAAGWLPAAWEKTLSIIAYASEHLQTTGLVKLKKLKKKNSASLVFINE
jgi:hypothetical protein